MTVEQWCYPPAKRKEGHRQSYSMNRQCRYGQNNMSMSVLFRSRICKDIFVGDTQFKVWLPYQEKTSIKIFFFIIEFYITFGKKIHFCLNNIVDYIGVDILLLC